MCTSGSPSALSMTSWYTSAAFRIVRGRAARQHEAAVDVLFRDPVRLQDADRILQPVEAGNLRDDRFVPGDGVFAQHGVDDVRTDVPVLVTQRVDGRRDQHLPHGQFAGETGRREHGRVVADHIVGEEPPDFLQGIGDVHVAPPDPPVAGLFLDQRHRLGIVDEDDVRVGRHPIGVEAAVFDKHLEILPCQGFGLPVKGVVEFLGYAEETLPARDHVPAGVNSQLVAQGHHTAENFRHAAAHSGRIDVLEPGGRTAARRAGAGPR